MLLSNFCIAICHKVGCSRLPWMWAMRDVYWDCSASFRFNVGAPQIPKHFITVLPLRKSRNERGLFSIRIFCGRRLNSLQILSVSALGWVREESLKVHSEWKNRSKFSPLRKFFFVIKHQHWTGRSAFRPFLALPDHWGGLGGPGGVMGGLKTLKMTLSLGDHFRP